MGRVKDMLMDVEQFVYDFYDKDGQLIKSPAFIVDASVQKFGASFGTYAKEILNSDTYPDGYEEFAYQQSLQKQEEELNDIPF